MDTADRSLAGYLLLSKFNIYSSEILLGPISLVVFGSSISGYCLIEKGAGLVSHPFHFVCSHRKTTRSSLFFVMLDS